MNRITFKVYFALDNIRRFTIDSIPSFPEFISIIQQLSPVTQQSRIFQYKDDEGDLITISSELEWKEMFSQFPHLPLFKIYISDLSKINRENQCPAKISCGYRPCREVFLPHVLQRRGLNQLNEKLFNEASLTFRAQCHLQPDNPIPYYNVACSESLMGNTENALEYLFKAIDLGYNDLEHILKDEDLVNIYHMDQFKQACDRIRKETLQPQSNQNTSHSPWAAQREVLHDMGYVNDELILPLLEKFQGDIQRTLQVLLGEQSISYPTFSCLVS